MQDFFHFLVQHWELSLAFVVILTMIIAEEMKAKAAGVGLSPQGLTQLINKDKVFIADVRSKDEFAKGHIVNAKNIPLDTIEKSIEKMRSHEHVVIVCESNVRSATAVKKLRQAGIAQAQPLAGGLKAWREAGMPLVTT